jgi:subtilisin family serine protease
MHRLAKAVSAAIASFAVVASAQAATYVVTANAQSFDAKLAQKIQASGGTITARMPQIGVAVVESDDSGFAPRAARVAGIRSVVSDYTFQIQQSPSLAADPQFTNPPASGDNDTRFDLQWGAQAIDVAGAWNAGYRGAGATVAVLDSGVTCDHPDLAPNLLLASAASFVPGQGVCHPLNGAFNHGTHVAGIIAAADNGYGTIGVAPLAKILPVKVLSDAGSGSFSWIIQGIVYAADHGADVINMSIGVNGGLPVNGKGANDVAELINATKRAVMYARSRDVLTIVSAGNDGMDLDHASGVKICDTDGSCYVANLRAFPPRRWAGPRRRRIRSSTTSRAIRTTVPRRSPSPVRVVTVPIRATTSAPSAASAIRAGCSTWSSRPAVTPMSAASGSTRTAGRPAPAWRRRT